MLRVLIDIEPRGDKTRLRTLAEIVIANITVAGGRVSSDYAWRIRRLDRDDQEIVSYGCLVDSYSGNAVDLLWEVLGEWKSGRERPLDNHGFAATLIHDPVAFWNIADPEPTALVGRSGRKEVSDVPPRNEASPGDQPHEPPPQRGP